MPAPHVRKDWQATKEGAMLTALRAKFLEHPQLTRLLLDTGSRKLIEHTTNDSYWGDGGNGSGQNRLGILLMQVRDEIARSQSAGGGGAGAPAALAPTRSKTVGAQPSNTRPW